MQTKNRYQTSISSTKLYIESLIQVTDLKKKTSRSTLHHSHTLLSYPPTYLICKSEKNCKNLEPNNHLNDVLCTYNQQNQIQPYLPQFHVSIYYYDIWWWWWWCVCIQNPLFKITKKLFTFFFSFIVCYQTTHLSLQTPKKTASFYSFRYVFFIPPYTLRLHFLFTHPPTIIALHRASTM